MRSLLSEKEHKGTTHLRPTPVWCLKLEVAALTSESGLAHLGRRKPDVKPCAKLRQIQTSIFIVMPRKKL